MSCVTCFYFDPGCERRTHSTCFLSLGRHGGGFGSRFGFDQYRHRDRPHVGRIGSAYVQLYPLSLLRFEPRRRGIDVPLLPSLSEAGKEWAGGKPPRRRRHRRTRSGRVVTVPNLSEDEDAEADEETGLLNGSAGVNGAEAATGHGGGVQPVR